MKEQIVNSSAVAAAKLLVGSYPAREVNDPAVYVRMIAAAFAKYSAEYHNEAIDRLTDRLKWMPTKADVVEVLEDIARRKADPVADYLSKREAGLLEWQRGTA